MSKNEKQKESQKEPKKREYSAEELSEMVQTLTSQMEHHKTMAVKAQGAIEVVTQMVEQLKKKMDSVEAVSSTRKNVEL